MIMSIVARCMPIPRFVIGVGICFWIVIVPAAAALAQPPNSEATEDTQQENEAETEEEAPAAEDGGEAADQPTETAASESDFDRFLLTNGEVHDGTLVGFRDGAYQLDSEGFGTIAVEPEQVARVDLAEPRTLYVKPGKRVSAHPARFVSRDGALYSEPLDPPAVAQPFEPGEVLRVHVDPIPDAVLAFRAQATMTLTAGNSETFGSGVFTRLSRTTDYDELSFEYEFGYQESRRTTVDPVNERFHRGQALYRYITPISLGVFGRSNVRSNHFSGMRFLISGEAGGTIAPELPDSWELSFDLGLSITYRDRLGEEDETYGGGTAALQLTWSASDNVELIFFHGFDISFDDTENWNNVSRLTGNFTVTDILSAGFIAEISYANQPAAGFRNTDFRLVATLGISI